MDFRVEGEPARVLAMVQGYFESDEWPHRKKSKITGSQAGILPQVGIHNRPPSDTKLTCIVDTGVNPIGCILWILVALVSFGTALAVWAYWWFFERDAFLPQVTVTAYPDGAGIAKVTVRAEKPAKSQVTPEYEEPVAEWIQRELVEKRRAAEIPQEQPNTSGGIPDQIKKLAELRDSGVISEEEFERKKTELLDRM